MKVAGLLKSISSAFGVGVSASAGSNAGGVSLSPGLWQAIMGGKSNAGVFVSEYSALNLPVVYNAVTLIAETIGGLPIDILQKQGDARIQLNDHPLHEILNVQPNPQMDAITLRSTFLMHALLWGNGYLEKESTIAGSINALWLLPPEHTRPEKQKNADLTYITTIDGQQYRLLNEQVLQLLAPGHNGLIGQSPISHAREAIGWGMAMQTFGNKFFANDAKSGGFLSHPGKLSPVAQKNLKDSKNEDAGLENAFRIRVLEEGMKFTPTTIPPEDAQFLGSREFQIDEIARIYKVPPILLQSLSKSTSWGSGIEQLMIAFVTFCLQPWVTKLEQGFNRKLLTAEERRKGIYTRINLNALMRGDMAARSNYYKNLASVCGITPNEIRAKEDFNPIVGFDKPLVPLNMSLGVPPKTESAAKVEYPDDETGDENEV